MDLTFNTNTDFDQTKVLITNIIKNTADDYDLFLSENSINNLSVHLTIAIIRIKSNNYIPMSFRFLLLMEAPINQWGALFQTPF